MTKYIVSYFGILGRAEPIRLAFVQGGVSCCDDDDMQSAT